MIDKKYCMSSFMAFRFIERNDVDFYAGLKHKICKRIPESEKKIVFSAEEVDQTIQKLLDNKLSFYKRPALLLSGGMDSGILASYLRGADAYTFRFMGGVFQREELNRAEDFSQKYQLNLHYVDIDWNNTVEKYVDSVMIAKSAPVHSIEPQIMQAAIEAKVNGNDVMIIGASADDVFGGCDKLLSKDWTYKAFLKRFMYTEPESVLKEPVSMEYAFLPFKRGKKIDFIGFLDANSSVETELSFQNAFEAAGLEYIDPYSCMKMGGQLELDKIRSGSSKYLIRELFAKKYPEYKVPEKIPMPRPVNEYFKNWRGPSRKEFRNDIDMSALTGNQKWQLYSLERFLNIFE